MFNFSDVDRWNGFIFKKYGGEDKARWLITLSTPSLIATEKNFIFCTTTTVEKGNLINQNKFLKLEKNDYDFFYVDCFVYFTEPIFELLEYEINKNISSIEYMGKLKENDMINLYLGYWANRMGSPIQLKAIKECYIRNGISNSKIPDPQRNR